MKYCFTVLLVFLFSQTPGQQVQNSSGQQTQFTFKSGFWINLHHFLYQQALLRNRAARLNVKPDTSIFNSLNEGEKKDWQTVLAYYQKQLAIKELLFDTALVKIKNQVEDNENKPELTGTTLPAELQADLNKVAPSYRTHFWAGQNKANQLWIDGVQKLVNEYGGQLKQELEEAYRNPWPNEKIAVDVTNYASWSGAYTTTHPNRITISSTDTANQNIAALEIVFHEASHIIVDPIAAKITEICRRDNKVLPDNNLWHAILFYTTGDIVKRHFKGYVPYAYKNGLWKRAWPKYIPYLEQDWQPYLDKKVRFEDALEKLVKDVEVDSKQELIR